MLVRVTSQKRKKENVELWIRVAPQFYECIVSSQALHNSHTHTHTQPAGEDRCAPKPQDLKGDMSSPLRGLLSHRHIWA